MITPFPDTVDFGENLWLSTRTKSIAEPVWPQDSRGVGNQILVLRGTADMLRDHRFHTLAVSAIVQETADTRTFILAIPNDLADVFRYQAGQFCTFRAQINGEEILRCYSMSSAPSVDHTLAVTVKRVAGGVMSNWLHDYVTVGDWLEVLKPSGVFTAHDGTDAIMALCGGSGVTPVFSLIKETLATTIRPITMLYANRDRDSMIFASAFDELVMRYPDRLKIQHHLDSESGYLTVGDVAHMFAERTDIDVYVCGPTPFMDIVEAGLAQANVAPERIRIERFVNGGVATALADSQANAQANATDTIASGGDVTETLTIKLKGKKHHVTYIAGDTVLDAARRIGLKPPVSCELGNCASCIALVTTGSATLRANNALSPAELAEGWILTCQAIPQGHTVVVEYEDL